MNETVDDALTEAERTEGRVFGTRRPLPARASVVIPAHNESAVIGRLLADLQGLPSDIEVVVVCNGCTDDTEAVAECSRGALQLRVISIDQPSKIEALNVGDGVVTGFPRVYLDADVRVSASAILDVVKDLQNEVHLSARPPLRYDTSSADVLVRAFYRARERVPYLMDSQWGAGLYAVSERGRARWGAFPASQADDYFVSTQFTGDEFGVVATAPMTVQTPTTTRALIRTLGRVYGLPRNTDGNDGGSSTSTFRAVIRAGTSSPRRALDALTYVAVAVASRLLHGLGTPHTWARDETSR